MAKDTGFPATDAQFDFSRARRRRALRSLANRLRLEPGDVDVILPFEEVVEALGRRGERQLGLQTIDIDSIVGTVDRAREFDRRFRPTLRPRARPLGAHRRGAAPRRVDAADQRLPDRRGCTSSMTAITACRWRERWANDKIDAYVTEVQTEVGAGRDLTLADLPLKSHERLFYERVPLPAAARERDPALARTARTPGSPRGSRRGGSARCQACERARMTREEWPRPGSRTSTGRWSRCCARPT